MTPKIRCSGCGALKGRSHYLPGSDLCIGCRVREANEAVKHLEVGDVFAELIERGDPDAARLAAHSKKGEASRG